MSIFAREQVDKDRIKKDIDEIINKIEDFHFKNEIDYFIESIRSSVQKYYGSMIMKRVEILLQEKDESSVIDILREEGMMRFRYAFLSKLHDLWLPSSLFIIGAVLVLVGYYQLTYGFQSADWPSTEGVIISSELSRTHSRGSTTTYEAVVNYKYTINGKEYRSNQVTYAGEKMYAYVKRYPSGKNVKVYYHPDDHAIAVLEPGINWENYLWFLGIFPFIFSLWKFYSFFVLGRVD